MEAYLIVLGFIIGDIVTGISKALYKEGLNSTILRRGLFHKLSEILAMCLCSGIEYAANYLDFGISFPAVRAVSVYICVMETISILENICIMNPQLRKLFTPFIQKLKNSEGATNNEKGD